MLIFLFFNFIFVNPLFSQECSREEYLEIITPSFFNDLEKVSDNIKKDDRLCAMFRYYKAMDVPSRALRQALNYYSQNFKTLKNQRYISIADYSQDSTRKRFYLLDLESGTMKNFKVSHGSGAKQTSKGYIKPGGSNKDLKMCMHRDGTRTNMTRPGFFKTGGLYPSKGSCNDKNKKSKTLELWRSKSSSWAKNCSHQEFRNRSGGLKWGWPKLPDGRNNALKLHGLNEGINHQAYNQGVVMHGAWYNTEEIQTINSGAMGRSYGCPAFKPADNSEILPKIKGGSLYYSYLEGKCDLDMKVINKQNSGWEKFCPEG